MFNIKYADQSAQHYNIPAPSPPTLATTPPGTRQNNAINSPTLQTVPSHKDIVYIV